MSFKLWLAENQIPNILYHNSSPKNRQSILTNGLRVKYGSEAGGHAGIFFSNKPDFTTRSDAWQVNVQGLDIEEDSTTQVPPEYPEDEKWYACYQDIPPDRIKLLPKKTIYRIPISNYSIRKHSYVSQFPFSCHERYQQRKIEQNLFSFGRMAH